MQCTRDDRWVEPFAVEVPTAFEIPIDCGALGCPALTNDRDDCTFRFRLDQDQRLATKSVKVLFHDTAHE